MSRTIVILLLLATLSLTACTEESAETPTGVQTQETVQTTPVASPTATAEPTMQTSTEHATLDSFAAACGRLVAKEREAQISTDRDAFDAWLEELEAEIPPPELEDFWEARKKYLAWLSRIVADYTPSGATAAYEVSMWQIEAISAEARRALFRGSCLELREWKAYEKRAMARERLSAMRETPLESIGEFAQACRNILATAPEPTNLDHRSDTLAHIAREWDKLVPSSDFETLYAVVVHSSRSALAQEYWSLDPLKPLESLGFDPEVFDAESLQTIRQAGC